MEKLRREWVDNGVLHWEPVYSAAEVDAYRAAVKALVESIKKVAWNVSSFEELAVARKELKVAIAAVERMEVE